MNTGLRVGRIIFGAILTKAPIAMPDTNCALNCTMAQGRPFCSFARQSRAGVFDGYSRHWPLRALHCGEPGKKGAASRRIGRTKGGQTSKLHAV
ncbi:MAG: hypothetical protein ACJAVR_003438 [Paracoccaceae bacterium]|jgi:hypothetical protein